MAEPGPQTEEGELLPGLSSVPAVARLAAGAWYRGATWGFGTALRTTERVLGLVGNGAQLPDLEHPGQPEEKPQEEQRKRASSLRDRGGELLERAAGVVDERDPVHPGFARIIDQLAPDEARILKLLVNEGPQGIVYVNKAAPFGIGAREIARRLSMIGHEAGCLHGELVPAYIDNLVSHGLVAIRRDALEDEMPYQVIEAQPEVTEAIKGAGGTVFRGQITRRSVHLTDFGRTFCQVCFPPEHLTGEFAAIEVGPEVAEVAPPESSAD